METKGEKDKNIIEKRTKWNQKRERRDFWERNRKKEKSNHLSKSFCAFSQHYPGKYFSMIQTNFLQIYLCLKKFSFPQNRKLYKYRRVHSKVALFSPCALEAIVQWITSLYIKKQSPSAQAHPWNWLRPFGWLATWVLNAAFPDVSPPFLLLMMVREGAYQVSSGVMAWTPVMKFISVLLAFYDFQWDCEYFFLIIQIFGEEGFELPGRDYTFPCIRKFIQWKGSNY